MRVNGWMRPLAALFCLLTLAHSVSLAAQPEARVAVERLSYLDKQYMQQQREELDALARRHLGQQFSGRTEQDLALLQALLDRRLVRPDQTRQLQGMGIILGDLLAKDLGMHWVVYEDKAGRSRALRYRESDNYLFPVTMISRRREAGSDTPVKTIYQNAYDIIAPLRPPLPFQ